MNRPLLVSTDEAPRPLSIDVALAQARTAGFDGVEVFRPWQETCGIAGVATNESDGDPKTSGKNKENRPVCSIVTRCDETSLDTASKRLREHLRAAGAWEVRCLALRLPPITGSHTSNSFVGYQEAVNFAYELMRRTFAEAESAGVPIALEVCTDLNLVSPVEFRELLDQVGSWAVGACIDLNRIGRVGLPEDWIRTLGNRVRAVRVHVGPDGQVPVDLETIAHTIAQVDAEYPLIATGTSDWTALRSALNIFNCVSAASKG